tara:strand:- start:1620 stop:2273 length:654 start_codon:yes stop_codon:yes gene_type:complete
MSRVSLIVVDNFYDNPDELVDMVHEDGFINAYNENYQNQFPNSSKWFTSKYRYLHDKIKERFEKIIGETIDYQSWKNINWNGRFLVKREGAGSSFHNHSNEISGRGSDSLGIKGDGNEVGNNGWSSIIFLNKEIPIKQGFMTVKPTEPKKFIKNPDGSNSLFLEHPYYINDIKVGNIYNRCVLFRGNLFHSGANGVGKAFKDARIVQGFFFRILGDK